MIAKHDLIRQDAPIDIGLLKRLYGHFQRRLLDRGSSREPSSLQLGFRRTNVGIWSIQASLHYELTVADAADLRQAGIRETDE
jgi:hypothetical protein